MARKSTGHFIVAMVNDAAAAHPFAFTSEATELVKRMTLEEKASFCSGSSFWTTEGCPRLGLQPVRVSDGPVGLRTQPEGADHLGLGASTPATCFPAGVNLGSSWDTALAHEMAGAVAKECLAKDVAVILGPAINMKRSPLCGRNFEYLSEDPFLAGELAAAYVNGAQAYGVGTSVKHFAANNQEYGRMRVDTRVDERTLRELYLPAFERAVVGAQPWTIMSAYNQINGAYCGENAWLLDRVLRGDWAFRGLVVSDWGGTKDRVAGVANGMDLEMPTSGGLNDRRVLAAVRSGALSEAQLDVSVVRVVSLLIAAERARIERPALESESVLFREHHTFARRVAVESAVLLKNERRTLPLAPSSSIALIGRMATAASLRYQGAGSAKINAHTVDEPLTALREHERLVAAGGSVIYKPGYDAKCADDPAAIKEAAAAAAAADVAVVFVGLPAAYEVEGVDRPHMCIPDQMNALVAAVLAANKNTVVVLLGGASMELPSCEQVPAILWMGLGGQAMGGAAADLLLGAASPSGKLAETWPMRLADCPSQANFADSGGASVRQVVYREALNVGYRYFCTAGIPVKYAFGHGLSYSSFTYSNLRLSATSIAPTQGITAKLSVTNAGVLPAAEVVQLYVRQRECSVARPDRELKAFTKVHLKPGGTHEIELELPPRAFAFYDIRSRDWRVEPSTFDVLVGASSDDIRLSARIIVKEPAAKPLPSPIGTPRPPEVTCLLDDAALEERGLVVPPETPLMPVTASSTFDEIRKASAFGWCLVQVMLMGARATARSGATASLGDGEAVMSVCVGGLLGSSFGSLQLMAGGRLPPMVVDVMVHLINGHFFKAIARLCSGRTP